MLIIDDNCKDKLAKARAHAESLGPEMTRSLEEQLEYLNKYACHDGKGEDLKRTRCELYTDFAPHSFGFTMHRRGEPGGEYKPWFNGGLIFHGPHDGGGNGDFPTLSVHVEGHHGWSVHT